MPRSSPSPELAASTTGMSGETLPEGLAVRQAIHCRPQVGRWLGVHSPRDSARMPSSRSPIHCSDCQRTLLPALLQPLIQSPGRSRSYFEEAQVVLKTTEKRREKRRRNRSWTAFRTWGRSDRLRGPLSVGDAQIRLGTGGDACFGRGDAFVAVTGGEKVHH